MEIGMHFLLFGQIIDFGQTHPDFGRVFLEGDFPASPIDFDGCDFLFVVDGAGLIK